MRKSETFTALNGLRFLAALAVVIFHYAPRVSAYGRLPDFLKNLIDEGPCAVAFFFILSGFVLGHRHLERGSIAERAASFYWARFARLYPTYLLAFLLFIPVAAQRYLQSASPGMGRRTFILSAALSALMLQSWTPLAQAWNGPGWSLSVEAFMYLMFPAIGYRLARLTRAQSILAMSISWLIPSCFAIAYVENWVPDGTWHRYITNNPLLWLPLFVMGVCASRMVSAWKQVTSERASAIATTAFVAFILVSLAWPHRWSDVFVTGGIAPLLVVVIIFFTRTQCLVARVVGGSFFSKLGEASYAIYILQAPSWHYWRLLTNGLRRTPLQASAVPLWQFLAFVPFLIVISLAVQRFIEIPLRAWLLALNPTKIRPSRQPVAQYSLDLPTLE